MTNIIVLALFSLFKYTKLSNKNATDIFVLNDANPLKKIKNIIKYEV